MHQFLLVMYEKAQKNMTPSRGSKWLDRTWYNILGRIEQKRQLVECLEVGAWKAWADLEIRYVLSCLKILCQKCRRGFAETRLLCAQLPSPSRSRDNKIFLLDPMENPIQAWIYVFKYYSMAFCAMQVIFTVR